MFGTKLRTWMEAHIVRSKKKKDRKKGEKGFDSNCNSPRNHSANRSPALHQVHPVDSPSKNVDGIRLHGEVSYGGIASSTATASASSGTSAGTGSVNLSSPESAYSTGYSTDGTSPGTSFPPEYYINIRTGTHYFQSNGRPKRPVDAADLPAANALLAGHGNVEAAANLANMTRNNEQPRDVRNCTPSKVNERLGGQGPKEQSQRVHSQAQTQQDRYHRRTESFSADSSRSNLAVPSSIPPPLVSPSVQSPRERSRIRTNPWLSANSSGSSTAGFKSRFNLDDTSSSSGLKLTESSGSASDVNVNSAREGRARKEFKQESLSAGRSPVNQNWRIASGLEIRPKMALSVQRRSSSSSSSSSSSASNTSSGNSTSTSASSRSNENGNENGNGNCNGSSASSVTRSVRSSEDDITLNEMMGKFDESYVYEKETDILSDSDPTDCEDYIDSLSDVDPAREVVDENDPLENDEFDYIDNGSFLDLDNLDCSGRFPNTGHCTYFAFTGELARRSSKLRESLVKRRIKEDATMLQRTPSAKSGSAKRQSTRHKKPDEKQQSEKRKKKISQRRKSTSERCNDETGNLNCVLVERMLLKNSGFNQGSRSVGGTPICRRRRKHDVNKNLSPMRLMDDRSTVQSTAVVDSEIVKRRSNSVSYVNGNIVRRRITGNAYMTTFASEIALIEADKEADKKYRELILEAENILVNMQKSQNSMPIMPSPSRKFHNGLANKRVELIKNTELNIELALSKSRNSQPELQSGSIRDLEHTSPKRQFTQPCSPIRLFMERNSPGGFLPKENCCRPETPIKYSTAASPIAARRTPPAQHSPCRSLLRSRPIGVEQDSNDYCNGTRAVPLNCNGILRPSIDLEDPMAQTQNSFQARSRPVLPPRDPLVGSRKDLRISRSTKEEGVTSSSSDSEERCDVRRRTPLLTFRSIDMGPIKESSSYCPQSEPVKRKVYAGSATYGRIQKTLGEHVTLRNSDGDTATDDTDDSRRSLKEKVAQLRRDRLAAEANANTQDSQIFQHQLSQLRRQMLMQTIEGLKRSLEDQSATLKQTCLEPVLTDHQLP